ncbi:MAG TPA: hypothetical protein VM030_03990 [Acidimicrobiales bacterium]|nr:hypothetical protein [Acidimicrobiales bacterium]
MHPTTADSAVPVLTPQALARDLARRDLTDPADGPHAMQLLVDDLTRALASAWPSTSVQVHRADPVVDAADNYDRLGYSPDAVTRDVRYTRYVTPTRLLRTHTSAMIPPLLRKLAGAPPADVTLVCPGIVYRRDAIDRLHTGTPQQTDIWRISPDRHMTGDDLRAMVVLVVEALMPGHRHRVNDVIHPYTDGGLEIEVEHGQEWVEIGECGVAGPAMLAGAGLASTTGGLAMGLGLDRILMLRKGVPDIRLLRSEDPRIAGQMLDLAPYRPVSSRPAMVRDLSVAVDDADDDETIGDRVRDSLGDDAPAVEAVEVLSSTAAADLPPAAAARLGIGEGQRNVLVRVVLRHLDRTLTAEDANTLRDRVYAAIHRGSRHQWAAQS